MALSEAMNSIGSVIGGRSNIDGPVELLLPRACVSSDSEDDNTAVRLPDIDQRKPLGKDAKDSMTDSDSDQQQQSSSLNSTSSPSCSFDHHPTRVNLPSSQHIQNVKKSFEASSSGGPRRRGANRGIKAARRRFLLEKAAKQQEAKAASKALEAGNQTSDMSTKPSTPLLNRLGVSISSSSTSSTFQTSAQQKAAPQPVVLLPSQSLYVQNPTPFSTITNGVYNQSSSHGRPNSIVQHPLPRLLNDFSHLSSVMTGRDHRIQNDWALGEHIFIKVCDLPDSATTRDLWTAFKHEGHIAHIRLYENAKGHRDGGAKVKFRYASTYRSCPRHRNN